MSLCLLVVEDDPVFQDLVRAPCERRGDSVDVASDGFLGLRLLSERCHDVVMIRLPPARDGRLRLGAADARDFPPGG